ncbi:MAG: hypothetical protein Q4P24_16375, partial [Rhodobacterales bacterium]|nr:hypothetical protein [Rhodobacterales bacterium]
MTLEPGNCRVSAMQFVVPMIITAGASRAMGGAPVTLSDGSQLWMQNYGLYLSAVHCDRHRGSLAWHKRHGRGSDDVTAPP